MFIDHVGIRVADADIETVVSFYVAALAPLGYKEMMRFPVPTGIAVGLGTGTRADFWVASMAEKPNTTTHIGFIGTREQVDAFHAAALEAGAKDNGQPGERPHYGPPYYAAFVYDPAGNNVEVVCREGSS